MAAVLILGACTASAPVPTPTPGAASPTVPPPTAVPTAAEAVQPTEFDLHTGEFVPPQPACPSPPGPVIVPDVRVSVGGGPAIITARGATVFATCTNTSVTDVVGQPAAGWLRATRTDQFRVQVQAGWVILHVEGSDAPAVGDGANIDSPIDTPDGPDHVDVPVPQRDGDARASWTVWLVRVDGKAVGQVDVSVRVHLPPAGG